MRFRVSEVKGDGNCLFRAVSAAHGAMFPNAGPTDHRTLRALATTHIQTHHNRFKDFVPEKGMGRDGTWGGEHELAALAEVMHQPIEVWCETDRTPNARNIFASRHKHFSRISVYPSSHQQQEQQQEQQQDQMPLRVLFDPRQRHYSALVSSQPEPLQTPCPRCHRRHRHRAHHHRA